MGNAIYLISFLLLENCLSVFHISKFLINTFVYKSQCIFIEGEFLGQRLLLVRAFDKYCQTALNDKFSEVEVLFILKLIFERDRDRESVHAGAYP